MQINLIGINHKSAPLDIREKVAVPDGKLYEALSFLREYLPDAVVLSTCNRTEIYTTEEDAGEKSLAFLSSFHGLPVQVLKAHAYSHSAEAAIRHLLCVTAGLESMVLGEYEILGQVNHALEAAEKTGMVNYPLRQLFLGAIRTGRQVRERTGISRNALSVSSVAVELATEIVGSLEDCKLVVIGAGEAGRLVTKAARERGTPRIYLTSRTMDKAVLLAEKLGGVPFPMEGMEEELTTTGIVVACADAPHWILTYGQIAKVMRKRSSTPLVIIDIAVPRNTEPAIKDIANVFLYNIDDLAQIAEQNLHLRRAEIEKANAIINEETDRLLTWWQTLETRPVVSALMSKADAIRLSHLEKTLKKLRPLSEEERENLDSMTRAIVTKILHDPVQYLKSRGNNANGYAQVVTELFKLDEPDENEK
ncbi:MAG: glutamyl-tRNA reductase [Dehalococcoidia bacterium]|nr:glutamyl-tRNA reductase [Dehalococcoidia bacterium]